MPNIPEMPDLPNDPNVLGSGGGWRPQRAAQLRSEAEGVETPSTSADGIDESVSGEWHTVQEGETLESIAEEFSCPVESIRHHPANLKLQADRADPDAVALGNMVYVPAKDDEAALPVGLGQHTIKEGECITSIAVETGHAWQRIWDDPGNTELRELRVDPGVLLPGDRVEIPEKRRKEVACDAEQRHRFTRVGMPAMLRLRVLRTRGVVVSTRKIWENDDTESSALDELVAQEAKSKPHDTEPYRLEIDGSTISEGFTGPDGEISIPLKGDEERGRLIVGTEPDIDEYHLHLGQLDPIETVRGLQQRLHNLGYACGPTDGIMGTRTRGGIERFQLDHDDLRVTRRCDEGTRAKLVEEHGS